MVRRLRPITLNVQQVEHGLLDDKVTYTSQQVMAHITEVNGAEAQTNLFGRQFAYSWVARVRGDQQADTVTLDGVDCQVIQIRHHATRTDIYFAHDKEVTPNGVG